MLLVRHGVKKKHPLQQGLHDRPAMGRGGGGVEPSTTVTSITMNAGSDVLITGGGNRHGGA